MPCPITIDVFVAVSPSYFSLKAGHLQSTKACEVHPNSRGQAALVLVSGNCQGRSGIEAFCQSIHRPTSAELFDSKTITRAGKSRHGHQKK